MQGRRTLIIYLVRNTLCNLLFKIVDGSKAEASANEERRRWCANCDAISKKSLTRVSHQGLGWRAPADAAHEERYRSNRVHKTLSWPDR